MDNDCECLDIVVKLLVILGGHMRILFTACQLGIPLLHAALFLVRSK